MKVETLQAPKMVNTPPKPGGLPMVHSILDDMIRDARAEASSALGNGREKAAAVATLEAYQVCKQLLNTHCR